MKHTLKYLLLLLLAIGLLTACSNNTTPETTADTEPIADTSDTNDETVVTEDVVVEEPTVPPTTEPTAVPEPEPTAIPEPLIVSEMEWDSAFADFLGRMTAYNTISLEDTNVALLESSPPFLLDVRNIAEAEENGHIEGAVLIPLRELGQNLDQLPDFNTPLIAYCGSGWRATIAMTALEALGWNDVKVMKGGSFGGWVEAGYPVATGAPPAGAVLDIAQPEPTMVAEVDTMLSSIPEGWGSITNEALNTELIENPDLILIDVRRVAEVDEKGQIDASNRQSNVPIETFIAMKDLWPADKDAPIVVYCGSGHRSTIGMTILRSYGYTNVRSLKGGFGQWVANGFPTVGGAVVMDDNFNRLLSSMVKYNTTSLEDTNLALGQDAPPFLLDVRNLAETEEKGHIEGAVLIPLRDLGQHLDQLPSFDTPIIAYCGSSWRATVAMTALEALGWENVTVLKDGSFGGWVEAGYSVTEGAPIAGELLNAATPDTALVTQIDAALSAIPEGWGVITAESLNTELIENPDITLIDVRTSAEVAEKGHINAPDNAQMNIPLEEFVARKGEWPADKDTAIVIYCGSGHRSTMATTILWAYGYTNVRSLKGGYGSWAGAGFPVTQDVTLDVVYDDFLANMQAYNTINLEDTAAALLEDPPPFLLDVREVAEVEEKGHIDSAILIPLRELGKNINQLPSFDTPIIAYCGSGWRATIAMTALQAMGWTDVKVMKGGSFNGWVEAGYPVSDGLPPDGFVLDVAQPEPGIMAKIDTMLTTIPEGWGVIKPDLLNTTLIENQELILIDVRRSEEIAEKGIIAADNILTIPLEEFIMNLDQWPTDKEAAIVTYCGSGHRSTIAMTMLWSYGYTNVLSLNGGFTAWAEAGYGVAELVTP